MQMFGVLEYDVDNECIMLMSRDEHEDIIMISRSQADTIVWLRTFIEYYEQKKVNYEALVNWRVYGEVNTTEVIISRRWKRIV